MGLIGVVIVANYGWGAGLLAMAYGSMCAVYGLLYEPDEAP